MIEKVWSTATANNTVARISMKLGCNGMILGSKFNYERRLNAEPISANAAWQPEPHLSDRVVGTTSSLKGSSQDNSSDTRLEIPVH